MREALLEMLRCPRCRAGRALQLNALERDAREVRDGVLHCVRCGLERPVHDGIADLLYSPPDFVVREAAGLERFAAVMRADGWNRERILQLPDVDIPYWYGQARAIRKVLATIPFREGERLLDVGANSCWASNIFARRGLDVVALDIATTELQGLRTADYFLSDETFFERVLSVMFDPALADESFDYVFCCEVLHHNDTQGLRRTMCELHRVLRPGGRLLVVDEPLRFPLRLKRDHGSDVAEFEGYEHVYFMHQYWRAARAAGFRLTLPDLRATSSPLGCEPAEASERRLAPLRRWLRAHAVGRLALRAYRIARFWCKHAIRGDANLSLVGVKAE